MLRVREAQSVVHTGVCGGVRARGGVRVPARGVAVRNCRGGVGGGGGAAVVVGGKNRLKLYLNAVGQRD